MSSIRLTPRESDVLRLMAEGQTTKVIAKQLGISPSTVKDHLKRLFIKFDCRGQNRMVVGNRARELGLL